MNLTLETIFSYLDFNSNYDNDYKKKMKSDCYDEDVKQVELYDVLNYLDENGYLEDIFDEIKSIKKDKLYKSFTHGYLHNERVLLIGYYIAKKRNMNEKNMKILLDACKYHDIGRHNDSIDDAHGLVSANLIQKVIGDDPFYEDSDNLNMLKCAIDYHSTNDRLMESMLQTYEIKDKVSEMEIMKVLKDSDGLDRVRLSMGARSSELNPDYLRTEEALSLVKFAHQLNELYLYSFKKANNQDELDFLKKEHEKEMYLHGIGYDFFKLENILKDGLLSRNELSKRNILSSRNFEGYNYGDYISVACYGCEYHSNNNAYVNHIRGKIAFSIQDIDAFQGEKVSGISEYDYRNKNILLPIDVGAYPDERFVKDEIERDKLTNLLIPKNILDLKLTEINYMSSSLSTSTMEDKINYYIATVEEKSLKQVNREVFDKSISTFRELDSKAKVKNIHPKDYQIQVHNELEIANKNIGIIINGMYQNIFQKEDVTLKDVIDDILLRNNLTVSRDDDNYLYINLGETKKLS